MRGVWWPARVGAVVGPGTYVLHYEGHPDYVEHYVPFTLIRARTFAQTTDEHLTGLVEQQGDVDSCTLHLVEG